MRRDTHDHDSTRTLTGIHTGNTRCDGMGYGMALMTHRTTIALDDKTAQRLKRLSTKWHVSQAEVVRRSLEQAESADSSAQKDPEPSRIADASAYLAQTI